MFFIGKYIATIHVSFFFFEQIQKRQSSGSMDDRPTLWARDYVESLHQNSRATLLFGKNNVLVQPVCNLLKLLQYYYDSTEWPE